MFSCTHFSITQNFMTEATGGVEVADWDGDGELDILLCSLGNNVSVRQLKRSSPDLLVEP